MNQTTTKSWHWNASTDPDVKGGSLTLQFTHRSVSIAMPSFTDALDLAHAIEDEQGALRRRTASECRRLMVDALARACNS